MPLVGVLAATGLSSLDYLRQGLRAQGYVEGQNVAFAFRSADGNPRDLPGLARHLASLNVDVLFVAGPAALDAAVHATSESADRRARPGDRPAAQPAWCARSSNRAPMSPACSWTSRH